MLIFKVVLRIFLNVLSIGKKSISCIDFLCNICYALFEIRKSGSVSPPYIKEVVFMVEELFFIIYLLFYGLVATTAIAFALIIALVIIISKQK